MTKLGDLTVYSGSMKDQFYIMLQERKEHQDVSQLVANDSTNLRLLGRYLPWIVTVRNNGSLIVPDSLYLTMSHI